MNDSAVKWTSPGLKLFLAAVAFGPERYFAGTCEESLRSECTSLAENGDQWHSARNRLTEA